MYERQLRFFFSYWEQIDKISGWMGEEECKWLGELAGKVNSWTEIGSWHGRSAMAVGLCLSTNALLQIVEIDWSDELTNNLAILEKARPDLVILRYNMSSMAAANVAKDSDVVFIDANHKENFVIQDITKWKYKCKILCGHDYNKYWPGVIKAVDSCLPNTENPTGTIWVSNLESLSLDPSVQPENDSLQQLCDMPYHKLL